MSSPHSERLARSLLFVPATSQRKVEKAFASAADGVIVDLEDAVALAEKAPARRQAAEMLQTRQAGQVFLRVNAISTPYCYDDMQTAAAAAIDGIMLPKAESAADIQTIDWLLTQLEIKAGKAAGCIEILPIIETARGLAAADAIAGASQRLRRLAFGAVDLALDTDIEFAEGSGAMAHARFSLALASRRAGLAGPLDAVFVDIGNACALRAATLAGRELGATGKMCIHPAQLDIVNTVFTPSAAALSRAQTIVTLFDAAEAAGQAAVSVDGMMVDYPVVARARRLLASAR